jgi:hypothetical protein
MNEHDDDAEPEVEEDVEFETEAFPISDDDEDADELDDADDLDIEGSQQSVVGSRQSQSVVCSRSSRAGTSA